jgi:hypothetical protein
MNNYGSHTEFSLLLVYSRGILIIVKAAQTEMKKPNKLFPLLSFSGLSRRQISHVIISDSGKKTPEKEWRPRNKNSFHCGEARRRKSCWRQKKRAFAVYFMITTLTYANNFDIMKGMMNIKHIKIKISIWITTTSCGW